MLVFSHARSLSVGIGAIYVVVDDFGLTIMIAVIAFFYLIWSYFAAGKAVLALNGAKQIQKRDNPRLYRIVPRTWQLRMACRRRRST